MKKKLAVKLEMVLGLLFFVVCFSIFSFRTGIFSDIPVLTDARYVPPSLQEAKSSNAVSKSNSKLARKRKISSGGDVEDVSVCFVLVLFYFFFLEEWGRVWCV